ncbi:MAG: sigma-70 family RNA polymerase sigma factor [Janthinobacterium lividum]
MNRHVHSLAAGPPEVSRAARVAPRDRRRDETRDRTLHLIGRLAGATAAERSEIRDEVVAMHLWVASSLARRYGSHSEFDDLVQVGRVGLVEAFDRFEPGQTTYANFAWITAAGMVRRHLRDQGWSVRPPRSLQESANQLRRAMPELAQDLGRAPSTADAAEHLGWTHSQVRDAQLAYQGLSATSIETLLGDSWVPRQPAEWDAVEARVLLQRAVQTLSDDERELLRLRFLDELAQSQIGVVLGINQMGVSRRLTRVLHKLRREIGDLDGEPDRLASAVD